MASLYCPDFMSASYYAEKVQPICGKMLHMKKVSLVGYYIIYDHSADQTEQTGLFLDEVPKRLTQCA